MCGFAGVVTNRSERDLNALLAGFRRDLAHRGPDGDGDVVVELPEGKRLGLAHTRLSILDLSPAGRQPMYDPDARLTIAFNGEIYNHLELREQLSERPYLSSGDTATLLRAWGQWGVRCLDSLRGMFAFALYDPVKRELWLARDPWGIKPLYVAETAEGLIFGSEIRALLNTGLVPRILDRQALEAYLAFGAVPAPWTLIHNVESLSPGEVRCYPFDGNKQRPRFERHFVDAPIASDPMLAESLLPKTLRSACRAHMLSDVPVGVFLSGGIDSGVVAATLAHEGFELETFSVILAEQEFDESPYSRRIAKSLGTKHHEILLTPDEVMHDVPTAVAAYDQPSIDGVNTYFVARATRQAGVKVALSGLGGDEFFAGYPYFRWVQRRARTPAPLMHAAAALVRWRKPHAVASAKFRALAAADDALARYVACRTLMPEAARRRLSVDARSDVLPRVAAERLRQRVRDLDAVTAQSLCEAAFYMSDMLLRDGDQMAMAHALEVRFPLLDRELTGAALAIPGKRKLAPGKRGPLKGLLLDACPIALPTEAVHRKKMGFVLPYAQWLRGPLRHWASEALLDDKLWSGLAMHAEAVADVWRQFLAEKPSVRPSDVLALVHLGCWARLHRVAAE